MFSKVYSEKYWSFEIFHLRNLWAEQCGKLRLAGTALGFHILISTAKTRKSLSVEERKKEKKKQENLPYVTQNTCHLSVPLP